jgi:hypothetical protein
MSLVPGNGHTRAGIWLPGSRLDISAEKRQPCAIQAKEPPAACRDTDAVVSRHLRLVAR